MSHDIFISHTHQDKPFADAACAGLEAAGIRCWIAPRDILPGTEWGESIVDAIADCRIMVVVFSAHANASKQVLREVERCVNRGVILIPLRVEDVMPSGSMEYFLGTPHWLDAMTPPLEQHIARLVDTAKRILSRPVKPPATLGQQPEPAGRSHRAVVEKSSDAKSTVIPKEAAGKKGVTEQPTLNPQQPPAVGRGVPAARSETLHRRANSAPAAARPREKRPEKTAAPAGTTPGMAVLRKPAVIAGLVVVGVLILIGVLSQSSTDGTMSAAVYSPDIQPIVASKSGQIGTTTLGDGSAVRVGPETKLFIPDGFPNKTRAIRVEGTAEFDVAPTLPVPFHVFAKGVDIASASGAGTTVHDKFAVSTFAGDSTAMVRVADGSVKVTSGRTVTLKASESAAVEREVVRDATAEELSESFGWLANRLIVRNKPVRDLRAAIHRWYGVSINGDGASLDGRVGSIDAPLDSVSAAAAQVETTAHVRVMFSVTGNDATVADAWGERPPSRAEATLSSQAGATQGGSRQTVGDTQVYFDFRVDYQVAPYSDNAPPTYPPQLRSANVEGEVLAQFVVDATGHAELNTFKAIKSTHDIFTAAVRAALPSMRFHPAELGGRKVKQLVQMPFQFSLTR